MLTIHPADPALVAMTLNVEIDKPAIAFIGIDGDRFAGSGGLAWGEGRCWMFFTSIDPKPEYAVQVIRYARKLLRKAVQLGETAVFTTRDPAFETAPRLLKMLGFEFVGVEKGQDLYRWQV
jgi:hypothetical protein